MIITKATYGGADCTEQVKSKIKDNRLVLRADNNIIGDTRVGVVKYLEITGELNGEVFSESVREGSVIRLPKSTNRRLGIFYSNNNNRGLWPAIYKSLDTIKVASEGKADIITCMWNEMPENPFHQLNSWYTSMSHLNQLLQIMQCLYSAKETAIIKQAQRTPMGELRAPTAKTSPTPAPQSKLDLSKLGFRLGERAGYSRSRGRIHAGRDIPIAHGTSLYAITDAVITDVGYDGGYGYYITFVDTNGIEHFYGHLREIPRFKRGQTVSAGTVLGYVGSTGRSTGSHLHWEVSPRIGEVGYPRKNVIDPIEYGFDPKAPFGAKISATQRRVASQNLRRERKGPQIYLINDNKPAAPATSSGGYYSNINSDINEFNMLNKFIQKKLLTDLSYL